MKPALGDVYTGDGLAVCECHAGPRTGRLVTVLRGMDCAGRRPGPPTWAVLENPTGQYAVDYRSLRKENDT